MVSQGKTLSLISTKSDKCKNSDNNLVVTSSSVNSDTGISITNSDSSSSGSGSSSSTLSNHELPNNYTCNKNQSQNQSSAVFFFGFTKRQWLILCNFALSNFFSSIVISLQGPFYPREAEEKGATATEYGFVFGSFELTMFIMCPICGMVMGKISPRFMYNVGIYATGICVILFGLLDYVDERVTFITMSFVIRIAQACGDSAYVTASFTLIAIEFPDSVATTFSALETCFGLGLIVGPTVGGVLYEFGGFFVTFFVVGCCLLLIGILTYFILPSTGGSTKPTYESLSDRSNSESKLRDDDELVSKSGLLSLIGIPSIALASFSVVISCSSIGFLSATLEPHLRESFGMTPIYTGLIFIIDGGMYALFAPIWGKLCDKTDNLRIFTLLGALLTFIGFLFVGPAPFIHLPTILWVTCVGLVIHGLGFGATIVSAFVLALRDAVARGFPDNVDTYGLCSGLWTSCFSLGCFIGPSIGGVLLDQYGFRIGSIYVLASQVLVVIITAIFMLSSESQTIEANEGDKSNSESTDLLFATEKSPLVFCDHNKLDVKILNKASKISCKNESNNQFQGYGSL